MGLVVYAGDVLFVDFGDGVVVCLLFGAVAGADVVVGFAEEESGDESSSLHFGVGADLVEGGGLDGAGDGYVGVGDVDGFSADSVDFVGAAGPAF